MEQGEHLKRGSRPTVLQLKYLKELETIGKKRGALKVIAERCNVNRSTISRYFGACTQRGILTETLDFTEEGKAWFDRYWQLYTELIRYLQEIGGKESEAEEAAEKLVENMGIHMLELILLNHERQKMVYDRKTQGTALMENSLQKIDRLRVGFCIYRMNKKRGKNRFSMAMQGFEPEAYIIKKNAETYLELKLKDMTANSRLNGRQMSGHLSSLKYNDDGTLLAVEVKDGVVQIPLTACKIHHWQGGENFGSIPITVTCSVGRNHMPESTALLTFWA